MALLTAVLIPLVALIVTPGLLFYFDITPKLVVLLAMMSALLIGWAFRRPVRIQGFPGLLPLLLLTLCSLVLSCAFSTSPALSGFGTAWRRYGVLSQSCVLAAAFLIAALIAGRKERALTVLRGIALGGLLTAMYGIAQYFGWDPLLPPSAYHIGQGIWTIVRPPGTLGYSSYYAVWLDMACFASVAALQLDASVTWRRVAGASAVVSACAMLLSGSRGAYLGLLAGLVVWLIWSRFRLARRIALGLVIASLLGFAFYLSPAGWQLHSRARWFAEDPWGGARRYLWRDSARMALDRPAVGYGPEVFSSEFPRYESRQLAAAYPDFAHESPHNIFLDALVSQGLPGVLALCGICAAGFAAAWRLRAVNAAAPGLAAALAAGVVSQQFVVFTIPTALTLYAVVAIAAGLVCESPRPVRRGFATVPVAALAAALFYFAVCSVAADRSLALAQRDIDSGDAAAAAAHYARYERWRLPGTAADLWYSRALLALAHRTANPLTAIRATAEAGTAALRATATAEYPANAWYSLAAFYASQNNAAGAETSLRSAIAANRSWFKPHWTLAQLLALETRLDEAKREAVLADVLSGGKLPDVTQTLRKLSAAPGSYSPPSRVNSLAYSEQRK